MCMSLTGPGPVALANLSTFTKVRGGTGLIAGAGGTGNIILERELAFIGSNVRASWTTPTATPAQLELVTFFWEAEVRDGDGNAVRVVPIGPPDNTLADLVCGNVDLAQPTCIVIPWPVARMDGSPAAIGAESWEALRVRFVNNSAAAVDGISISMVVDARNPTAAEMASVDGSCGMG